jgi:predicted dehydrogenase
MPLIDTRIANTKTRKHIGLIGCGNWGKRILEQLITLGCEVSVVARSRSSIGNAMQYQATRVVSTIRDLKNVDGLVVATATETHFDVIEESLSFNVPIFVEKPLTTDLEQTDFLRKKAFGKIFVMDKYRYHPAIKALAELAATEELGKVRTLKTRRQGWGISAGPVNCIWDLAPHELSIAFTILGNIPELKYKRVDLIGGTPIGFTAHFGDLPAVLCEVAKVSQQRSREVVVIFSEGIATWSDQDEDHVRILRLEDFEQSCKNAGSIIKVPVEDPLTLELQAFLAFLNGGPEPVSNLNDAYLFTQKISEIVCMN